MNHRRHFVLIAGTHTVHTCEAFVFVCFRRHNQTPASSELYCCFCACLCLLCCRKPASCPSCATPTSASTWARAWSHPACSWCDAAPVLLLLAHSARRVPWLGDGEAKTQQPLIHTCTINHLYHVPLHVLQEYCARKSVDSLLAQGLRDAKVSRSLQPASARCCLPGLGTGCRACMWWCL